MAGRKAARFLVWLDILDGRLEKKTKAGFLRFLIVNCDLLKAESDAFRCGLLLHEKLLRSLYNLFLCLTVHVLYFLPHCLNAARLARTHGETRDARLQRE